MEMLSAGVNPAGSAITSDGRYLYVANNNNYGIPGADNVTILDLSKGSVFKTVNDVSFNEPYTVTIDKKRKTAYVTNSNTPVKSNEYGTVTKINIDNGKVSGVIGNKTVSDGGFDGPSSFTIHKNYAYVCNYGGPGGLKSGFGKTVSVVNLDTDEIIGTINVDQAPATSTVSPCGKYLYVACYVDGNPGTGTLQIFSTRSHRLIHRVNGLFGPFNIIALKRVVFVSNFGSNNFAPFGNTISVIDPKEGKIIKEVNVGIQPSGLAVTPDGNHLVVTCYNTLYSDPVNYNGLTAGMGSLVVLDTNNFKQKPRFVKYAGMAPGNVTLSPNGKFAYVSNYIGNMVTIVCLE